MAEFQLRAETDQHPTSGQHRFSIYGGEPECLLHQSEHVYPDHEAAEQAALRMIQELLTREPDET